MIDARLELSWNQTAHIIAAAYNAAGAKPPVQPHKVDPYQAHKRRNRPLGTITIDDMLDFC